MGCNEMVHGPYFAHVCTRVTVKETERGNKNRRSPETGQPDCSLFKLATNVSTSVFLYFTVEYHSTFTFLDCIHMDVSYLFLPSAIKSIC